MTKGGSLHCTFSVIRSEKSHKLLWLKTFSGSKPLTLQGLFGIAPLTEPLLTDTFAQCHRPQLLFQYLKTCREQKTLQNPCGAFSAVPTSSVRTGGVV